MINTTNYIDVQVQPVPQPAMNNVRWLAINVVNFNAQDDSYGQAQYQLFDEAGKLLSGNVVGFSDDDSKNWITDQEFANWLTINKLNLTPIT